MYPYQKILELHADEVSLRSIAMMPQQHLERYHMLIGHLPNIIKAML